MVDTYLLSAKGVGKTFSGHPVLSDVSFDLRPGEVHVLAGENGAGKSTFIKTLAGFYPDFKGQIELAPNAKISVIHQELSLIDSMSIEDNIFLGHESRQGPFLDRASQRREAERLCKRLDLNVNITWPVENFSFSVKNRVEIAKALSRNSNIIIMDEPTSGLTKPEAESLFRIINQLKSENIGVVYISHKMDEIYRLADRITVLRDGKKIGTSPAKDLPEKEFVRWMIGRTLDEKFPQRKSNPGQIILDVKNFKIANPSKRATSLNRWLVEDIHFQVRSGEILGLAGLQNSGASDILEGLFGAHGPNAQGELKIEGKSLPIASPQKMIESGIGLLTSDRKATGLILNMSIAENISLARMNGSPKWIDKSTEKSQALKLMQLLRIRSRTSDEEVGFLSGGNQQKVVLAKWLETKPKILFLDEPTRGVDIGAKQEIYQILNQLTDQGVAIVLISTEMPELLGLSDRIMVLHRGRVAGTFLRNDCNQEKILRAAMGERVA